MKKLPAVLILLTGFLISSCVKDDIIPSKEPVIAHYLHISHTRTNDNYEIDEAASKINYSKYDMVWLGGDMEYLTSEDDYSMEYLNTIFDVGNKNTLWSIGNHDYSNIETVSRFTNRPTFYSCYKNGITFIVFDTQYDYCSITGLQKEMFDHVTDTIEKSSHLIILHHKLIWMYANDSLDKLMETIPNAPLGDHTYNINPNNFYTAVYPKLTELKQRGIEVLCIAGDIGLKTDTFEYISPDGICFLASGIHFGYENNKALLFEHDITNRTLTWKYVLVNQLAAEDSGNPLQ